MRVELLGDTCVDVREEARELLRPVPVLALVGPLPFGNVERGAGGRGAVPDVAVHDAFIAKLMGGTNSARSRAQIWLFLSTQRTSVVAGASR